MKRSRFEIQIALEIVFVSFSFLLCAQEGTIYVSKNSNVYTYEPVQEELTLIYQGARC
jgi:hypothetical protein